MNKKEEMKSIIAEIDQGQVKTESVTIDQLLSMKNTAIVDVRSPGEYREDHITGAINLPILDNEERALIGTIYKKEGKDHAVEKGIGITEGKLEDFRQTFRKLKETHDQVVIYCFRGGMRSQSMTEYLNGQGIKVMKLEGGYKAYRKYVLDFFEQGLASFTFVVLHGHTGAGKTELLSQLVKEGYDALDLEYYAKHSGSVFGDIFFQEMQPPQKIFETAVFDHLYHSKAKYIFMESESPKIGKLFVPQPFCRKMERDLHILVNCSAEERIRRLVRDYTSLDRQDDEMLKSSVNVLRRMLGNEEVNRLEGYIQEGNYSGVADFLIRNYYDKFYSFSIDKYRYLKTVEADDLSAAVRDICAEFPLHQNAENMDF